MNEWLGVSETLNLVSLAISIVLIIVGLCVWFFVNRASVRANEHISLLEELIELQKRQNSLLRRLCEANEPEPEPVVPQQREDDKAEDKFVHMIAER